MSTLSESKGANWEPDFVSSLLDPKYFDFYIAEGVDDRLLPDYTARSIWHWARDYRERSGEVPTLAAMEEEFPKYEFVIPRAEPHFILDKLKERWVRKNAQEISKEMATTMVDKSPDEMYEYMRAKVLEKENIVSSKRVGSNFESFDEMWLQYNQAVEAGMRRGFTFGFDPIDELTGGMQKGWLVILMARMKRFKSWFLLQAYLEQVARGHNPILFTLELSEREMEERIWAMVSGVSYNDIVKGQLEWEQKRQIEDAMAEFREKTDDRGWKIHMPSGQRTVSHLFEEADRRGADSMIIDQLSFIKPRHHYPQHWEKYVEISYDLKEMASGRPGREMPVYVAHQMNRGQDEKDDLAMENIAGSDEIGRVADAVYGLRRNIEMIENNLVQMQVMATRHHDWGQFYVEVEFLNKTHFEMHDRGEFPIQLTTDPSLVA